MAEGILKHRREINENRCSDDEMSEAPNYKGFRNVVLSLWESLHGVFRESSVDLSFSKEG